MLLSSVVLVFIFVMDIVLGILIWMVVVNDPFLFCLAMIGAHILACACVTRALMKFLPITEGLFSTESSEAARWMAQAVVGLVSSIYFDKFVPLMLRPYWYRLFGAKIGRGVYISGRVIDLSLTTMKDGAQLGEKGLILGHYISNNQVRIGRVVLEKNTMAGACCMLFPGVTIKEGGVVGAMSLVPAGRTIGVDEKWSGNPAIKLPSPAPSLNTTTDNKKIEDHGKGDPLETLSNMKVSQKESEEARSKSLDVEKELKKFIQENCWSTDPMDGCREDKTHDDFDEEMLDSLGWMQLLTFVDKHFGVRVSDTEVADDCDWSIRELAQLIHAKKVA